MDFVHFDVKTIASIYRSSLTIQEAFGATRKVAFCDNHLCKIFDIMDAKSKLKKESDVDVFPIYGFRCLVRNMILTEQPPFEVKLFAKNLDGFRALLKISSAMHLSETGCVDWSEISAYKDSLLCISGNVLTEIGQCIYYGQDPTPLMQMMVEMFGERVMFEIQEHYLGEIWESQVNQFLLNSPFPLILTNDVAYLTKDDAFNTACYLFSSPKSVPPTVHRLRYTYSDHMYLKSAEEMFDVATDIAMQYENGNRAFEAFNNTLVFADMIADFDFKPEASHLPEIENAEQKLRDLVWSKMHNSYPLDFRAEIENTGRFVTYQDAVERVEFELNEIASKGYSGYFLILYDIFEFIKANDILTAPGRGSAVGSAVMYVLEITHCEPLQYELLFERFLNPERVSEPDVDVDIESEKRGMVIDYVVKRYGKEHIAQILTIGMIQARSAIHATCKGLGVHLSEEDRLAKLMPKIPGAKLKDYLFGDGKAILPDPELRKEYDSNPNSKRIYDIALWMESKKLISNFSIHAGGIVISKSILSDHLPLVKGDILDVCVAVSMKQIENRHFSKYDLLGVKILNAVKRCMKHAGFNSLREIPLDPIVFEYLSQGEVFGIFQFNKTGEICRNMGIQSISDLTVINALNRPGPMALIPEFIDRKKGKPYSNPHPSLDTALNPTFGIMVYQETIMIVSRIICGFSLGEADLLRRAIGKKDKDLLEKMKAEFLQKAVANGYTHDLAVSLFELIEYFADYGFNKPHAVAYAFMAYICAYFKYYMPEIYMCQMLIAHQNDNEDADNSPYYLRKECERMGIRFLTPSVNSSDVSYRAIPEEKAIQYGLSSIKNIGEKDSVSIMSQRPYSSYTDFSLRCQVSRRTVEFLIKAGAFDEFADRKELIGMYGQLASVVSEDMFTLYDVVGNDLFENEADVMNVDILNYEREALGDYITEHPISYFRSMLNSKNGHTIESLSQIVGEKRRVLIGCIISKVKVWKKQHGCFAYIEDETGFLQIKILKNTFDSLGIVEMKKICNRPIVLEGTYFTDTQDFKVRDAYFLNEVTQIVEIACDNEVAFKRIDNNMKRLPKGNVTVVVVCSYNRSITQYLVRMTDTEIERVKREYAVVS